jgi:hypothetical protein
MAYLRISEARAAARSALSLLQKSAGRALTDEAQGFSSIKGYDIFLSHSYDDAAGLPSQPQHSFGSA